MHARLAGVLLLSCAAAHGAQPTGKAAKVTAPDLEFLEYLGTLESDDGNWTHVANVAKDEVTTTTTTTTTTTATESDAKTAASKDTVKVEAARAAEKAK